MKTSAPSATIEARYRRRAAQLAKIARWPAIGALVAGGALLAGSLIGPSIADRLGERAGWGFARGVAQDREQVAAIERARAKRGVGT